MSLSQRLSRVRRTFPCAFAFTLALPLAGGLAQAQQPRTAQQPEQAQTTQQAEPGEPSKTLVIDFTGGSLLDYVRAVQKAAGGANVITSPGAENVALGPASLKNIDVQTALEAAHALRVNVESDAVSTSVISKAGSSSVYLVTAQKRKINVGGVPDVDDPELRIYTIKEMIEPSVGGRQGGDMKAESILSAIDTAVGLIATTTKPVVKYHPDSGLVLVRANRAQIQAVDQVVSALRAPMRDKQSQVQITELASQLKAAQDEIAKLNALLAERQKAQDKSGK